MTRPARSRPPGALLLLLLYWGYVSGIHGSVAPLLAASFHLGDAEIARLFSWIGVASLLALAAGGAADAIGRRRALLGCAGSLALAAAASACAQGPASYLAAQLAAFGLGTALLQIATVSISEALPPTVRARGQARAGLALAVGTALPLLAAAALAGRPDGWRGVWAVAALPLLGLPWLARGLPETRWNAGARRARGASALRALLHGAYRGDALRALGAVVAIQGAEAAARAWLFYYPVRHLDLDPRSATLLLLAAGGVGLAGFPLGGWLADTRGRRPALLAGAALFAIGVAGFYGSTPPPGAAGLGWLFVSLVALAAGGNGALSVFRTHAAELLPAPARGTFGGLLAVGGALGWSLSMAAVAALADAVGGVGHAVACVVMAALPAAALLLRKLPAARPFGAGLAADAGGGALATGRPWNVRADAS